MASAFGRCSCSACGWKNFHNRLRKNTMCGICGKINLDYETPVEGGLLQRMCDSIRHRGPDGEGQYLDGPVGLGSRRLSIIDLATGDQPICNEDGSNWIVFNGEIYNYLELYDILRERGHIFKTHSDTETILHAYEEWGPASCTRLRGMFAYAIWDGGRKRLVIVRDRLGKKPMLYTRTPQAFLFGSELRAILQDGALPRRINQAALAAYLMRLYVPTPQSAFEGIYKLPPAHYLILEAGQIKIERYWHVDFAKRDQPSDGVDEQALCDQLWALLRDATRMRLMSEVPLGAFLSGGIDSSAIVALMSQLMSEPVKTFSIRFEESRYDETPYARQVARLFNTDHEEFTVRSSALEVLPQLVWHFGEPFADASAIPTYYVSKLTRQHVTVALSGDAGDENFAGYDYYRAARLLEAFHALPASLRKDVIPSFLRMAQGMPFLHNLAQQSLTILQRDNVSPAQAYVGRTSVFSPDMLAQLCQPEFQTATNPAIVIAPLENMLAEFRGVDGLERWMYLDVYNYLPDDINVKVDIASMANSLEVRAPFLDHKVVEFAASLPPQMKLNGSAWRGMTTKYILKKAMQRILPKDILYRRKHGFAVPLSEWFRGELRGLTRSVLLSPQALGRGYFIPAQVERMIVEHERGTADHGTRLWALLNLEMWQRTYIDELRQSPLTL
jgi:asparagine synthase (glutamine-hydrolysing)